MLVETLYPCTDQIVAVGGPWTLEIGGLGGDPGGFGSRMRTFAMCGGGALVTGSFAPCTASESSVRGPVEGFGVLLGLV